MIALGVQPRILVVALRRLGDVLLTTPLIRSLKRAWPAAAIDVLVFRGTEGILAGNDDVGSVVTLAERPARGESLALLRRLWRRYDLALSTQSGDRPTLFSWAAGRRSVGFVDAAGIAARLKWLALDFPVLATGGLHRVDDVLRLAEAIGIPPVPEVVAPKGPMPSGIAPDRPYAVIHAAPMFRYKRWTLDGWQVLAAGLDARGLAVLATGGPADRAYLDEVWTGQPGVCRLDGTLPWPQLAALIAGARVYLGPDTSVTHLAAASGTATVALYGPTDPRLWGPWPAGGLGAPWDAAGTIQNRHNVWLVQNPPSCPWAILPCQQEGCLRRLDSHSQCLDELTVSQVLSAVDAALASPAPARMGASGAAG
ncbi:MAG: glycosyltransferase family 9 protein [Alphaproteobacteria bacterium]|nr:MAG: glycosyltransferase family 9 protein [Alphaproteobacteria bacterium]